MSASALAAGPGLVRLEGDLNFAGAVPLRLELERALATAGSQVTLDFGGVLRSNSVGLSLILLAARQLEERGGSLRVSRIPSGLKSIASVCELDEWLASITVEAPTEA
ncbi:STAS domain-containing protein [Pseudomonas sp.]|uniref:STAS domain-containing protein n=1 Tax=Pseudomonas sp. TaxID=306 RepID=UPI00272BD34B|nr:STAS domain-containing protein [Pseudomonas sp.]